MLAALTAVSLPAFIGLLSLVEAQQVAINSYAPVNV